MSPQPHEEVLGLCTAGFAARCLHIIADLGVADHIDDAPSPIGTLAAACEVDADALGRVLRLLSAYGIFGRHADGYRHTPSSRLLRSVSRATGFCPPAAMKPAHWWPPFLPTGGHETAHRASARGQGPPVGGDGMGGSTAWLW